MKTIGYIRVSTDKQDLDKQRHLLLEFANRNKIIIDQFIEVEISATKEPTRRKIGTLLTALKKGDTLVVAELSRLGRNMLETLNIIDEFAKNGVSIIFVRQPELSTTGGHTKLLLAIYSYFAESEREFIATRTRQGLAAAKASGKKLGRPKGCKNKKGRVLDPYQDQIMELVKTGLSISSIAKLINRQHYTNHSYITFAKYVRGYINS